MLVGIMHSVVVPFRALTKEELVIEGLSSGRDAALNVRQEGIAGRGVFATEAIKKGSWLCEYKTTRVFNRSELKQVEAEYLANNEGSYIVEAAYAVGKEGHLCFDATRKYHQFGRYINHAKKANAMVTPPFMVRGKWMIGFVAVRAIDGGDEVVWDYQVGGEDWSGCRLIDGVVKPAARVEKRQREEEAREDEAMKGGADEGFEVAMSRSARHFARRRLCYCPVEGCTSKPLVKLSNHLSQVHNMSPKERAKYLGLKRKFASSKDVADKVKKTTLRRSQRTLPSMVASYRAPSEWSDDSESENPCSSFESEANSAPTVDSAGLSGMSCLEITESEKETDGSGYALSGAGLQDSEIENSASPRQIRADKVARLSPASTPADSHSPSARQTSLHV